MKGSCSSTVLNFNEVVITNISSKINVNAAVINISDFSLDFTFPTGTPEFIIDLQLSKNIVE